MTAKLSAGRRVSARLLPAEDSLDQSIRGVAELHSALTEAQQHFALPPADMATLLSDVDATRNALAAARRNIRRAHVRILRARSAERMDESDFGCTRICLVDMPAQVAPDRLMTG